MTALRLGSLFDGIGVFPLAAVRCGIEPIWASEIEKAPISITKRHFPDMAHLGDVTKLDGRDLPPVHRLLFFESKDELIYHYGLIHCGEKLFREIDRGDILAWRKQDYEYQILVADREAAARKYKGCVIDPATLDDIMLLYIKGGSL